MGRKNPANERYEPRERTRLRPFTIPTRCAHARPMRLGYRFNRDLMQYLCRVSDTCASRATSCHLLCGTQSSFMNPQALSGQAVCLSVCLSVCVCALLLVGFAPLKLYSVTCNVQGDTNNQTQRTTHSNDETVFRDTKRKTHTRGKGEGPTEGWDKVRPATLLSCAATLEPAPPPNLHRHP